MNRITMEYLTRQAPLGAVLACVRATVWHGDAVVDFVEGRAEIDPIDVRRHALTRASFQTLLLDRTHALEGAVYGRARLMVDLLDGTVAPR